MFFHGTIRQKLRFRSPVGSRVRLLSLVSACGPEFHHDPAEISSPYPDLQALAAVLGRAIAVQRLEVVVHGGGSVRSALAKLTTLKTSVQAIGRTIS
jgi:hypothetical protein